MNDYDSPILKDMTCAIVLLTSLTVLAQEQQVDPKLTEDWSRQPEVVTPGENGSAPSDATLLFDGSDLSEWVKASGEPAGWKIVGDAVEVVPGSGAIMTKQPFGDCQLHIEWMTPMEDVAKGLKGQKNGNSGIFLMRRYEIQVLNSFENETYYNGMAGSVYKQHIPLVNPTRQPGKWQTYDIFFTAPKFNSDKTLQEPGYVTVVLNGVLIQNHVELKGPTVFRGTPSYSYHGEKAPLLLQDHSNKVRYRNIWIREL